MRSSSDPVTAYAREVCDGRVPAGRLHRLACERHLRDLAGSPANGLAWSWPTGDKVCRFFRLLKHFKGAGWANKPIELQPWQVFIVGSLFGWLRADGRRRFRNAFIELPRGNGKSTLIAGIGLWMAFFDGEPGAEVYIVATKRDQAREVFRYNRQMVLKSGAIRKRGVQALKHQLYSESTESKLEPLGADADTLDGLRPHCGIADEVHKHRSPELIEVIESGMGTRDQPLMLLITTAGDDDASVYGQHHQLSVNVLERDVDLAEWFTFIACADPEDDWTTDETSRKANPNYGISVKPDFLNKEIRKALANPQEQAKVRRLYLGQKVGAEGRYIPKAAWDACARTIDEAELRTRPCYFGLDISSKVDLTALVLIWVLPGDTFFMQPFFWMPAATLTDRKRQDRVPYDLWRDQGVLEATPGNVVDQTHIRQRIVLEATRWKLQEVTFDPWNSTQLMVQLGEEDGLTCVEVRQGSRSLSEPTKALLELVLAGRLLHGNHPVMNWQIANLRVKRDVNDNVQPDKQQSRSRIDGPSALITGLSRARLAPAPKVPRARGAAKVWTRSGFQPVGVSE
jgi:phage terminase large subunit-like protein